MGKLEVKKAVATKFMDSLAELATGEVKKTGVFTIPGLCRIKTKKKAATKAGKREMFGKMVLVKAKPAKTVVKAIPASNINYHTNALPFQSQIVIPLSPSSPKSSQSLCTLQLH